MQNSNGFQIVHPQGRFHAADPFAWVIQLDGPIGTTQVQFILVQEQPGGAETVIDSAPLPVSNPNDRQFAKELNRTDGFMGSNPSGTYKLEVSNGTSMLASVTFEYLG
jgi:hypothetical protein